MPRPVLVLRHARQPSEQPRIRFSPWPVAALLAALAATLAPSLAPSPAEPSPLPTVSLAAMSRDQLANRAEYNADYARRLGHRMAHDFGFRSDRQWHCLRRLWDFESSWHVHADNAYSRAYGIPQANPGSKMSTAGDHWRRNAETQIRWGLRYVRHRYGHPCSAWRHDRYHHWY